MNDNQPSVLVLSLEEYEIPPSELAVFAIQAPELPCFKLAHYMNNTGEWALYNTRLAYKPLESRFTYKVFHYDDKMRHVNWFLLGKEPDTPPFIAGMPMADCFLMAVGSGVERLDIAAMENKLYSLPDIFLVEPLPLTDAAHPGKKTPYFDLFSHFYNFLSHENLLEKE